MSDDEPTPQVEPELPQPITPDPGKEQTHGLKPDYETKIMIDTQKGETRRG